MDNGLTKISNIVNKVSELQVLKMAYSVYLKTNESLRFAGDEDEVDEVRGEALEQIDKIDKIMVKAQINVEKRISKIDENWKSEMDRVGSFTIYLQSLGAKVVIIDEDRQKDISFNIVGIPMTVDEMLEVVG